METLFENLSQAVAEASMLALAASFAWGILSIVLSPCHLASLPLIVGFINGQGQMTAWRACRLATAFSVGILITIAAVGAVTAAAGRMMGDLGAVGNYVVAGIFFIVGLQMMDVIPMPWSGPGQVGMKRRGTLAAFILGLVFGIALGPCTFAFMAPMLAVTYKVASTRLVFSLLLLLAWALGHCAMIILAGASSRLVQNYLNWDEGARGALILRKVCGVMVLAAGVYLIYVAP